MNKIDKSPPDLPLDLVARFAEIVGRTNALTDPQDLAPYLIEDRNLYHGRSSLVLRPGTTAEVAAICKLANATRTALVPQGGNTGLVGGQIAMNGEVVLSMRRLDKVRDIDPQSNTMTVDAGVVLATAQQKAIAVDRLFPLALGSEASCTIGGNLSTNAGGTSAMAFGVARDLVLGLEVVLADGRVLNGLSKLKKDNTGYDLRDLFIGAEGTLGVITAAVVKLFPRPRAVETAFIGLNSPDDALKLLGLAQADALGSVTSFELITGLAIDFYVRHIVGARDPLPARHPWYVLIELSSSTTHLRETIEGILSGALDAGLINDAVIAESLEHRQAFWRLRDSITPSQKPEGGSVKHDVSVPVAAVPAFIAEASEAVRKLIPGARPFPFGHLGDGNIHFNISQPVGGDKDAFLARWYEISDLVHGITRRYGGSISAEHGIGVMKRDELPHVKDPVAMELMRTLKATLDPHNILNPGKVL